MSLRAYSRHRGCTLRAVQKAIESKRIAKTPEGQIDSDAADVAWQANTDHGHYRNPARQELKPHQTTTYTDARALRESYTAQLARLEYEQKAGELVSAREVANRLAGVFVTCRSKILAIPTRARQQIPHLSTAEVDVIDRLVREALEELSLADGGAADHDEPEPVAPVAPPEVAPAESAA